MTIVLATVLPVIRILARVIRTASALQIGVALVLFVFADRAGASDEPYSPRAYCICDQRYNHAALKDERRRGRYG